MKKIAFIILAHLAASAVADSGYIVHHAEVTRITSSSGNQDIYRLHYSGGTGDSCNGEVRFHLTKAGSEKIFDRTFTLALTAFATGSKVDIFSYTDATDCDSAVTIVLRK